MTGYARKHESDESLPPLRVIEGGCEEVSLLLTRDEAQELFQRSLNSVMPDTPASGTALRKLASLIALPE
jgi:hypothetical protein